MNERMDFLIELSIFSGYKSSSVQNGDSKKCLGPIEKKNTDKLMIARKVSNYGNHSQNIDVV